MKIGETIFHSNKFQKVRQAVETAERKVFAGRMISASPAYDPQFFPTAAGRHAIYSPVSPYPFLLWVETLNPAPGGLFIDWGSGFGKICFLAAELNIFSRIIGYEKDGEILAEAESVRTSFGYEKVSFIGGDFTKQPVPGPIGRAPSVIYTYQPFFDRFVSQVKPVLLETEPGTTVIATLTSPDYFQIFPRDSFARLPDSELIKRSRIRTRAYQRLSLTTSPSSL